MSSSIMMVNLSWNNEKWQKAIKNPDANHSYTKRFPGHESLNFDFNKTIDTDNEVYGYAQFTKQPVKFENGGLVIFYSKNTKNNKKGQIIGIYGDVHLINPRCETFYRGFENDKLWSNMRANKKLSLLFPKFLDSDRYLKYAKKKRLVGQIGFSYYDDKSLVEEIIFDEIKLLMEDKEKYIDEIQTLKQIYKYYFEEEFDYDNIEQQKIIEDLKNINEDEIVNLIDENAEQVEINSRVYKRNNFLIAKIKKERNFECQICGTKIQKRNGEFYIEAAHIKAKKDKGNEKRENILILCPNHHKEFDFGKREIIEHNSTKIKFKLNNKEYELFF